MKTGNGTSAHCGDTKYDLESLDAFASSFGFNYLCVFGDTWYGGVGMGCIVCCAFYLLSSTADNFFSPTLATICGRLKLSPELAGVTFLAFGNGAPDVFSSFASITSASGSSELGFAALLGAAMFLLCVVFGNVCKVSGNVKLNKATFLRDALFFMFTIAWILAWGLSQKDTTVWIAGFYVIIYLVYVGTVFGYERWQISKSHKASSQDDVSEGEELQARGSTGVFSAFWNALTDEDFDGSNRVQPLLGNQALLENQDDHTASSLIYEEVDASGVPVDGYEGSSQLNDRLQRNTSSVSLAPEVIEDYIPVSGEGDIGGGLNHANGNFHRSGSRQSRLSDFYWSQLALHDRAKHMARGLAVEYKELPKHEVVMALLEQPFNVLRSVTIPSVDEDGWNKSITSLHPLASLSFLLFISGSFGSESVLPRGLVIALLIVASFGCLWFQFLLHRSRPPSGGALVGFLLVLAFICSVGWVYLIANELVSLLNALGFIVGANPSILGLTVLAWGNSAGDLVANTAIAKQGLPTMAIAGCFGSPLLNILIGIGLSLTILCIKESPNPVSVQIDDSCLVSAVFLLATLAVIIFSCHMHNFMVPPYLHRILGSIYFAYIAVSLLLVAWR